MCIFQVVNLKAIRVTSLLCIYGEVVAGSIYFTEHSRRILTDQMENEISKSSTGIERLI